MPYLCLKTLLKRASLSYDGLTDLEQCLFALKNAFDKMPSQEVTKDSTCMQLCTGLGKLHDGHTKPVTLSFAKPARVDLVGSYLLHTLVKPSLNVDVAVEMPSSCFVPKDFLDYRYHDKRLLYLSGLLPRVQLLSGASIKLHGFDEEEVKQWSKALDRLSRSYESLQRRKEGGCFTVGEVRAIVAKSVPGAEHALFNPCNVGRWSFGTFQFRSEHLAMLA